ncbi:MAG TPA: TMEM175 family protein [Candidatus Baltobacteraceae bacterium]|nr:TMEM175 family protein [Candidatus Baltobacteraceae bacterium]
MRKERLVAFSDGVFAVIITIMVLELKVPHGTDLAALHSTLPVFLVYVLSFLYVGIYWNNHHHLLYACERINGRVMWSNLHLLFWLSLIPFTTGWMGENHFAAIPTAVYGVVLLLAGIAYWILVNALIAVGGAESMLARAIGSDFKGRISLMMYAIAIASAFVNQWIADALYVLVAVIWLVPDRRIEKRITEPQ